MPLFWLSLAFISAEKGQRLAPGSGAMIDIVTADLRRATMRIAWKNFRTLLPAGVNFDSLDQRAGMDHEPLAAGDHPARCRWRQKWTPSDSTLETVDGYSLVWTDRKG